MKIKTFNLIFVIYCLISVFMMHSYAYEPPLDPEIIKRDEEELALHKMYVLPMNAISDILEDALLHCNRLPDEKEFSVFVIKGPNPNIRCTQAINLTPKIPRTRDIFFVDGAQNKVDLQDFLKKHQLQVHSDTKTLYIILKQDRKNWQYKYFKAEDYDFLIYCADRKCHRTTMDRWKRSCRNNPSLARSHCYLGDKKVIDYELELKNENNNL